MARKKQKAKDIETTPSDSAPLLPPERQAILDFEPAIKQLKPPPKQTEPSKASFDLSTTNGSVPDELGLGDPETDEIVDAIVADEADRLLAADDQAAGTVPPPLLAAHPRSRSRLGSFFKAWWTNQTARRTTIAVFMLLVVAVVITPSSRYFLLNTAGVQASISLIILDEKTAQPLKNVAVSLSGKTVKTDTDGIARVDHIKLGTQTLRVNKAAFATVDEQLTIGWGSNPLSPVKLKSVGSRYTFRLNDFLSGKPISQAEAVSGEANARSNDKGELVLTVLQTDKSEIRIQIKAKNYRSETLKIANPTKASQTVKMAPSRPSVFVSKRVGTYDVYKVDADGKNEQKLLAGTGSEQPETMALVPHPTKEITALVSTRDNVRNKDGFLLSTLDLISIGDGTVTQLDQSERIQILDWIGDRLIYVKIAEGESAASPQRHRLLSYDLKTGREKELASTNYFNDVMVARGAVYYSPAVYKVNGAIGLFRIGPDGSDKKTVSPKEAWNLFRTSFDIISVSMGQEWYEYNINDAKFVRVTGAPPKLVSHLYSDSPDGSRSLWTEDRDGKGTLLAYEPASKNDKVLQVQSGLRNPVRWLDNDHLVYRVAAGTETTDYVMSLSGGQPRKIADVTPVAGTDRWYY